MESRMIWPRELYLLPIYVFARTTPRFWQLWKNRFVTYIIFLVWGEKRRVLQNNLSVLLGRSPEDPAVRRLTRNTWQNYGLYLVDYVQMNRLRKVNLPYLVPEQRGAQYMKQALDEGHGAILVTPHLGNWELGGVTFALRRCPIHAITLKNPESKVQDFRDQMRGTLGVRTVHIDPNHYDTVLKLIRLLRENQFIAMLGDRWEGGKKVEVTFFGRRVIFPAGASALALASGAPIIPVFTVLQPNGHYLSWGEPPIRVTRRPGQSAAELIAEKTQELARVFETVIVRYPDQWYHFFDYWGRYGCESSSIGPSS